MVRDGQIDTIVVAITDMQGRLMGKRVQGQAFLDGVISHGAHFCTYLLGTDMEMNTPEGFKLMNWETGYGDWIAEPVWDQLRVLPWLPGRPWSSPTRSTRRPATEIPIAPRTILKRQVAAGRGAGLSRSRPAPSSSSTSCKDSWEELAERGWPVPRTFGHYNEDYHLLQATKAEPLHRLLRNQMTEPRTCPIEFSKGEAANGQHEVNIRYDHVLESADRSVVFKHGAKEIAYLNGWGITFMAKPDHRWTGSSGHLHMSLWDVVKDIPLMHAANGEPAGPYGLSAGRPALHGRDDGAVARAGRVHRPVHQLVQALRVAVVGAGQRRLGPGQPDDRVPARRARPGAPRRGPLPGRRHERLPDLRGDDRAPACTASSTSCRSTRSSRATATSRRACQRMPRALYEAIWELERSEAAVEIFGQDVVDHYLNAARVEQETYDSIVHPWDRERYLERG